MINANVKPYSNISFTNLLLRTWMLRLILAGINAWNLRHIIELDNMSQVLVILA